MLKVEDLALRVTHLIHRYFIWVIVGSYVIAAFFPALGLKIRDTHFGSLQLQQLHIDISLPSILLASLLLNAGLGVNKAELAQLANRPGLLLAGLIANIGTPLAFIFTLSFVMSFWHDPEEVQQILMGLALVASMPIAGASTAWVQNANGNLALSLGLVLLTTAVSPFVTPFILHAVGFVTTGDYSEDLHELADNGVVSFLGVWVILPSVVGIMSRLLMGELRFGRLKPYLKLANYGVLITLNYSNASLALPKALLEPDLDFIVITILIVIGLCVLAFWCGYRLAIFLKCDRNAMVSLMFGLGMSNNGTGLVLASMSLSDHPQVMLPIIFYNLVQHLVAGFADKRVLQRDRPN